MENYYQDPKQVLIDHSDDIIRYDKIKQEVLHLLRKRVDAIKYKKAVEKCEMINCKVNTKARRYSRAIRSRSALSKKAKRMSWI